MNSNSQTVEALWDAYNVLKEIQETTGDQHWGITPLIERVRIAAVAAQSGPSDSGWQPISTAPKTPARISPQSDWHGGVKHGPVILLSFWDAEGEDTCRNWGTDIGWWEPHIERGCRICKQENTEGCWRFLEDDGGHDIQPTWWRPLPAPYATDGTGQ